MKAHIQTLTLIVLTCALSLAAQPTLERGDIIVSASFEEEGGTLALYGRDGTFKGNLAVELSQPLSDPLYRDGIIYVATRAETIERFDMDGQRLTPFTTNAVDAFYISPGPNGGLLAAGSSYLMQFAADGTRTHFLPGHSAGGGAMDLASDGCTAFAVNGRLIRWDACTNGPVVSVGASTPGKAKAIRILPDGTFLITVTAPPRALHLDAAGNIIRDYNVVSPEGLALDIDGSSFWTNTGFGLRRVDIASGAIITQTPAIGRRDGLATVGEPRASFIGAAHGPPHIPALSPGVLVLLALSLAAIVAMKLRVT